MRRQKAPLWFTIYRDTAKGYYEYHVSLNRDDVESGRALSRRIKDNRSESGSAVIGWFADARIHGAKWVERRYTTNYEEKFGEE